MNNKVQTLLELFPMLNEAKISTLLQSNNGNMQETINAILGVSGTLHNFPFFFVTMIVLKSKANLFLNFLSKSNKNQLQFSRITAHVMEYKNWFHCTKLCLISTDTFILDKKQSHCYTQVFFYLLWTLRA